MNDRTDDIIRASEIGEYVYCARAWWLRRVQGVASHNTAALRSGLETHSQHGRLVAGYRLQRRLALLLVALALAVALIALVLIWGGGGLGR